MGVQLQASLYISDANLLRGSPAGDQGLTEVAYTL